MADTRSSDVLAVPSMICMTAVSTVVADVCTRIGYNTTTPVDTLDLRLGNIVDYMRCNISSNGQPDIVLINTGCCLVTYIVNAAQTSNCSNGTTYDDKSTT